MKRFATATLLIAALALLSACTTTTTPQASPSPSVSAMPAVSPSAEASLMPSASANQGKAEAVGNNATIVFDGKAVNAKPYYNAERELVLPLKPLAEAMGWTVKEATSGTQETMTLTRDGADEVIVTYTKPTIGQDMATMVTAKKGTQGLDISDTLVYAENHLYVPESFIKDALENVEVKLEGEQVTVTPAS